MITSPAINSCFPSSLSNDEDTSVEVVVGVVVGGGGDCDGATKLR